METEQKKQNERGSVLVLSILLTMVILGVGLAAMWVAQSGSKISMNLTRRQEALNAAEAGVERARAVLAVGAWNTLLGGCDTTLTVAGKGVVLCDSDNPLSNEQVVEYSTAASNAGKNLTQMTYTVYVRNDGEAEYGNCAAAGINCDVDNDQRIIVRSEGVGRDGISYAAVEAIVTGGPTGTAVENVYTQAGGNQLGNNTGVLH